MLLIHCPFCGPRDHSEFAYIGDASVVYPPLEASEDAWFNAVYLRDNPKGLVTEIWHHVLGCRAFLILERNTLTHEIMSVRLADPAIQAALQAETAS
ncbi:MAG: sarcosine oxidase subunit delta [Pseudomonadota bacterium]